MRWFSLLLVACLAPCLAQEMPRDWVLLGRKTNGQRYQGALRLTPQGQNQFAWTRAELVDQSPEWTQGKAELRDGRLWLQPGGKSVRHVLRGTDVSSEPLHGRYAGSATSSLQGYVRYKEQLSYERLIPVKPGHENHVDLYVDGARFFAQLRSDIAQAKHSVNVQSFILTDDSTGRSLEELMIAKAQQGVPVRVLIDKAGDRIGRRMKKSLRDGGVELIVQHSLLRGAGNTLKDFGRGIGGAIKRLFGGGKPKPRERRGILNHDHRKITVIDGRAAYIGGMNLAHEYEHVWHDIHSRVVGPAVTELEELFFDRWHAAGGKGQPSGGLLPSDIIEGRAGQLKVEVVTSLPGISRAIRHRYLHEINTAQREVLIEVAYFLDDEIIDALQAAAARGVYVVVILPNDQDHDVKLVRDAFAFVQNDVVRSGVVLLKYPGRMVHSKVATFDGRVATVGSANLDGIALDHLSEANLFIPETSFAGKLNREVFLPDIPKSVRVKVRKIGFWAKLKSRTLRVFRGFL